MTTLLQSVLNELINYSPYNDEVIAKETACNTFLHRAREIHGNFDNLPFAEQFSIARQIAKQRDCAKVVHSQLCTTLCTK